MNGTAKRNFSLALAATVLAGCVGNTPETSQPKVMSSTESGYRDATGEESRLAQLAVRTLADELGIDADQISVDTVRKVDWRDSSYGCPQPGQAYQAAAHLSAKGRAKKWIRITARWSWSGDRAR